MAKGNARSSGYDRAANDWYVEPKRAVTELLDVETFHGGVWDPACGGGNIPTVCKARGIEAYGSDLIDRGYGLSPHDFLAHPRTNVFTVPDIVCNPPFSLAVDFALTALDLMPGKVCILQRTVWVEGERRYKKLFSRNQLMRIWQFRSRISMPPGQSTSPAEGGAVSFAWFVFQRSHCGVPAFGWLP